jgi:hypothetical protein
MKPLILAVLLIPASIFAQAVPLSPQPGIVNRPPVRPQQGSTETLKDNYQIGLTLTDKDAQPVEISVVVASTQFNSTLGEQGLSFSGTVAVEDAGSILVTYYLGWQSEVRVGGGNNIQYQPSSAQGSVRLKPGEAVEIIRAGNRAARLVIKKLEPGR